MKEHSLSTCNVEDKEVEVNVDGPSPDIYEGVQENSSLLKE